MSSGHTITLEPAVGRLRVVIDGETLADSSRAQVLRETGYPPRYYVPRDDVQLDRLVAIDLKTTCPFKGDAEYWSFRTDDRELTGIAWSYPVPIEGREELAGLICFFDERVDELTLDGTAVSHPA